MSSPHIGVVAPVYNEQECLPMFRERLGAVLDRLGGPYDVYLVDDGSSDNSATLLAEFAKEDPRWHGVYLARNFGHQAAITAGIAVARGDVVVVMDSDLQDEPEAIPQFIEKWREGYDTVYAVRVQRKEGLFHRAAYWLFYRMLNGMSDIEVPVDSGDFCLMDRRVVDALNSLPERARFVRGLRAWVGYRQTGLQVERNARVAGEVKYTFRKLVQLAVSGALDFSYFPLRVVSYLGLISIVLAFAYLAVIVAMRLTGLVQVQGWTTVVFLVIGFGGMILLSLGAIGEYLGRTFTEVKNRPTYIIARTTDDADPFPR